MCELLVTAPALSMTEPTVLVRVSWSELYRICRCYPEQMC